MNYDFPSKRHWRRSLWNCVADRLSVARKDALVLYLAGEQDEDREVAIQKGFRSHNLIAVDREKAAVRKLRERGSLALCGDVFDHLDAWNCDRPINAVILDLTCDLSSRVLDSIDRLPYLPQLQDAVIAINVCRGRAADWSLNADFLQGGLLSIEDALQAADASKSVRMGDVSRTDFAERVLRDWGCKGSKHRGELLRGFLSRCWCASIIAAQAGWSCEQQVDWKSVPGLSNENSARFQLGLQAAKFQTLSYRSVRRQTYDTLVFRVPLKAMQMEQTRIRGELDMLHRGSQLRRLQAAIWAHRTMRMAV
jgi:hypothetical protein